MFDIDFYEEQENSLDILVKFNDDQHNPSSNTLD